MRTTFLITFVASALAVSASPRRMTRRSFGSPGAIDHPIDLEFNTVLACPHFPDTESSRVPCIKKASEKNQVCSVLKSAGLEGILSYVGCVPEDCNDNVEPVYPNNGFCPDDHDNSCSAYLDCGLTGLDKYGCSTAYPGYKDGDIKPVSNLSTNPYANPEEDNIDHPSDEDKPEEDDNMDHPTNEDDKPEDTTNDY